MASLFRPIWVRNGVKHRCRVWYGQYRDAAGQRVRVPLSPNREAAQLKLAELVRDATDTTGAVHKRTPLADHVAAWEVALEIRDLGHANRTMQANRVRCVLAAADMTRLADLGAVTAASAAERTLHELQTQPIIGRTRGRGISAKTRNCYADTLKAFGRWLVETGRLTVNPFTRLRHVNVATDRRHDRRPLSVDEIAALLSSTEKSGRSFRNLTPRDRHALYVTALATGFRAGELASLTSELFRLDESPPLVLLPACDDKARRAVRQPVARAVADMLRGYLADRRRGELVWPGSWREEPIKMLRRDLADAGVPYVVPGPDGPLFADFHALRHTFIAMLDRPSVTLKQAMTLARHADPRLTMRVYGAAALRDLAAAVDGSALGPLLAHAAGQVKDGSGRREKEADRQVCATRATEPSARQDDPMAQAS